MRRPRWLRRRPSWIPAWVVDPPRVLRLVVASALSVTVAVLATLAVVATVTSYRSAQSALHTRDDTAARSSARISALSDQIGVLSSQAQANSTRIGELIGEVHALEEQVRQMGGAPVVTEPRLTSPTTTTTTIPTAAAPQSPSPAPPAPTTTTTSPPPSTTTTTPPPPCTSLPVVGCINAKASRSADTRTNCGDWLDLISSYDWPVGTACRIMLCESSGDPNARNRSGATGLFQILGGPTDPAENVALAYSMWSDRGWQPWVCH